MTTKPRDPVAYRRDRRRAVLDNHPDHGGSTEALISALAEVDRRHGMAPSRSPSSPGAEQMAAMAVTVAAGVAALGLSLTVAVMGRRR